MACTMTVVPETMQGLFDEPPSTQELGRMGEDIAEAYLAHRGMEIVERNWRCKLGEADIIGKDDDGLVMVEVKTRYVLPGGRLTWPEEAVTLKKINRYKKLAMAYFGQQFERDSIRLDVVGVSLAGPEVGSIHYIRNAWRWDD